MCLKLTLWGCHLVSSGHRAPGHNYMTAAYFQTWRQVSYFSFTAYTKCFFWPHFTPATIRTRRGEYWPYLARIENVKPQNVFLSFFSISMGAVSEAWRSINLWEDVYFLPFFKLAFYFVWKKWPLTSEHCSKHLLTKDGTAAAVKTE